MNENLLKKCIGNPILKEKQHFYVCDDLCPWLSCMTAIAQTEQHSEEKQLKTIVFAACILFSFKPQNAMRLMLGSHIIDGWAIQFPAENATSPAASSTPCCARESQDTITASDASGLV